MSKDDQLTLNEVKESNTGPKAAHIENSAFGDIPGNWKWKKSKEYLKYIESGISESQNKDRDGIPVSRIETIANGTVNYDKVGYVNGDSDYSKHRLNSGDILFSNINSRKEIGKTAIYKGEKPLYHGMNLLRIRYKPDTFNPYFAYYVYDSPMAQNVFFRMSKAAVGQSSINQSQIERLFLPTPPLSEQHKIAAVLYTIDDSIQKTEELIEQINRLKEGLLQQLFTKGYYDHEEFEKTRAGELPQSWELSKLKNHVELISGAHVKSDLVSGDESLTPYITGPDDFDEFGFTVSKYTDNPTKFCEPDDTLVTVKGSGCGKSTFADQRACISRQLKSLRPKETIEPLYLYYFLRTKQNLLETLAEGSAIPGLSNSHLTTLDFPVPSIKEQREISEILRELDRSIGHEQEYKSQLQRLKRGLQQDLLSGTVRTTDTNIEVPDEIAQHG